MLRSRFPCGMLNAMLSSLAACFSMASVGQPSVACVVLPDDDDDAKANTFGILTVPGG